MGEDVSVWGIPLEEGPYIQLEHCRDTDHYQHDDLVPFHLANPGGRG